MPPQGTPEGELIQRALERNRPGLSVRQAAKDASISEGRWRQIAKGFQSTRGGDIPVIAPAETLARMALVAGVMEEDLRHVGRGDAADALLDLLGQLEYDMHDEAKREETAQRYLERFMNGTTLSRSELTFLVEYLWT